RPLRAIIRRSSSPERSPLKGSPVRSPPRRPGASPTKATVAGTAPSPGTTRERHLTSAAHRAHPWIAARSASSTAAPSFPPCCGIDPGGAPAFEEQSRAVTQPVALLARACANLIDHRGQLRAQQLDVDSRPRRTEILEHEEGL